MQILNYISEFHKLVKEGCLDICTEHDLGDDLIRIRTVFQLDADLLISLPRKHLDEIMGSPDIYQEHLIKLQRYLTFMKWLRISFIPTVISLAALIIYLVKLLF